jgi:hypothetical protein
VGIIIGVCAAILVLGLLVWLLRSGARAQAEMEHARRNGVRRRATVLSWAEIPRSSGTYQGSRGRDRRHFYLTVRVPDGGDYQASSVWTVKDESQLAEGGEIPVIVHPSRPDIVWPAIGALDYDLGDYATKYYKRDDSSQTL